MPKNRYINTHFWSDNFIVELKPLERYLFLYLLTNEKTTICGIYELPMRTMIFETGLKVEELEKILRRLEEKIVYTDGWVCLTNFVKHQSDNKNIQKGIQNTLDEVPKEILAKIREKEMSAQRRLTPSNRVEQGRTIGTLIKTKLESKFKSNLPSEEATTPPTKKEFGSEEINSIFSFIREKTGLPATSGQAARNYAQNLLRALKKNYPAANPVDGVKAIITRAIELNDGWHSTKVNDPKHLFYNWQEIINKAKGKAETSF